MRDLTSSGFRRTPIELGSCGELWNRRGVHMGRKGKSEGNDSPFHATETIILERIEKLALAWNLIV